MSIVKMKRLRLIGMRSEREEMLRLLQHMGCVEIDEPPHLGDDPEWAALTRPDPGALNAARDARSRVEGALRTLKKYGPKQKGGLLKPRPVVTEEELFDDAAYEAGLADAGRLGELERRITALYAEQNKLRTPRLAYSRCSSGGRSAGSSTPSTASRRRSCICCFTRISYRLSVFCAHRGTPSALSAPDSPAAPCRY